MSDHADPRAPRALPAWLAVDDPAPLAGWIGFDVDLVARAWRRRNAAARDRLTYRPVGAYGEPYPDWVRALRGTSGVYVIRDRATREPLYVGVSAADKLYETMTRHLQRWTRWKGWWRGQFSAHDPGMTYDRDRVEVAARTLSPERAAGEEARLIRTLKPRDNVNLTDAGAADEVPF
jgi:hypothetical protein